MYQPSVPLLPCHPPKEPLQLFAEVLYSSYTQPRHAAWVKRLPEFAQTFGFEHINVHGAPFLPFLTINAFPLVSRALSAQTLSERDRFREIIKGYKQSGMRVTLGSGGVRIPEDFFEKYPQARNAHTGLLMQLLEAMVVEYFEIFPEADEMEIYFWEAMLAGDGHMICPEMYYGGESVPARFASYPYYAPEDFLSDLITAYARGAQRAGKVFSLLTFSHYPWQEEALIKAIKRVDPRLPVVLDHKCQPGDWTPQRQTNNVLEAFPTRPALMMFDGAGEYWGQCRIPYCYPEEIAYRLQHALEKNPSIASVGMRVMWQFDSVFGNFNEVNLFALARLAKNPYADLANIWGEWAKGRFGDGAGVAQRALVRTNEIVNKSLYIEGAWIFNHSVLSDLTYLESHLVVFGKAMIEWYDGNVMQKGRLREAIVHPSAYTIGRLLQERCDALAAARLSLSEVEAGKTLFPMDEYEKLRYQLNLLVNVCRLSYLHMELFMRYWILRQNPAAAPQNNGQLFTAAHAAMRALADELLEAYGGREPLIVAADIARFVEQVSAAMLEVSR